MGTEKKEFFPELDERGFMVDLMDLKRAYRTTHKKLSDRRRQLETIIEHQGKIPFDELSKRKHRPLYQELKIDLNEAFAEIGLIEGMLSDVNFAIEWLHTGKQPGAKRGIERRSVYQNTVLLDPMIMANYANPSNSRSGSSLTEDEKRALREVLEILSPQERECYVMAHGHCIPQQQIARMLNLSEGSVATYIKRAHEKVSRGWQGTFF